MNKSQLLVIALALVSCNNDQKKEALSTAEAIAADRITASQTSVQALVKGAAVIVSDTTDNGTKEAAAAKTLKDLAEIQIKEGNKSLKRLDKVVDK